MAKARVGVGQLEACAVTATASRCIGGESQKDDRSALLSFEEATNRFVDPTLPGFVALGAVDLIDVKSLEAVGQGCEELARSGIVVQRPREVVGDLDRSGGLVQDSRSGRRRRTGVCPLRGVRAPREARRCRCCHRIRSRWSRRMPCEVKLTCGDPTERCRRCFSKPAEVLATSTVQRWDPRTWT